MEWTKNVRGYTSATSGSIPQPGQGTRVVKGIRASEGH